MMSIKPCPDPAHTLCLRTFHCQSLNFASAHLNFASEHLNQLPSISIVSDQHRFQTTPLPQQLRFQAPLLPQQLRFRAPLLPQQLLFRANQQCSRVLTQHWFRSMVQQLVSTDNNIGSDQWVWYGSTLMHMHQVNDVCMVSDSSSYKMDNVPSDVEFASDTNTLPRTHVYLDIACYHEDMVDALGFPQKRRMKESLPFTSARFKLSNSPWGYMKGPAFSPIKIEKNIRQLSEYLSV